MSCFEVTADRGGHGSEMAMRLVSPDFPCPPTGRKRMLHDMPLHRAPIGEIQGMINVVAKDISPTSCGRSSCRLSLG